MPERSGLKTFMPPHVRTAGILTFILAAYASAVGGAGCTAGLMSGPNVLIVGVVHSLYALVLFASWDGLRHKARWARRVLIVVSALTALAISIAVAREWVLRPVEVSAALWLVPVVLMLVLISLSLSSSSANSWFRQRSGS